MSKRKKKKINYQKNKINKRIDSKTEKKINK